MVSIRRARQNNPQLETAVLGLLVLDPTAGCTGVATTSKLPSTADLPKNPPPLTSAQKSPL